MIWDLNGFKKEVHVGVSVQQKLFGSKTLHSDLQTPDSLQPRLWDGVN